MRSSRTFVLLLVAVAAIASGCSGERKPPEGRWQGAYEDADVMIAARAEVGTDGRVRVSAPNAFMDLGSMDEAQKADVRERLAAGLASSWPQVQPRSFEFDGKVFRNPGGVAPQLELDAATHHVTMYVYPGSKPTIRIDMLPVKEFQ